VVPNCGPKSGSRIGVLNWGPKSGSQIRVLNWGSIFPPNRGPKSESQIRVPNQSPKSGSQIRVLNQGPKSGWVPNQGPKLGSQIRVPNGGPKTSPKSGSQIGSQIGVHIPPAPHITSQIRVLYHPLNPLHTQKRLVMVLLHVLFLCNENCQLVKDEEKAIPLPASCDAGKN
jgi:hypothetical protein